MCTLYNIIQLTTVAYRSEKVHCDALNLCMLVCNNKVQWSRSHDCVQAILGISLAEGQHKKWR